MLNLFSSPIESIIICMHEIFIMNQYLISVKIPRCSVPTKTDWILNDEKKSSSCNCRLIIHFLKLYLTKTYFNTTVSLCSDWHTDAAIHLILCLIKDHNVQFTELLKKAFRCNWVVANTMLYVYSIWCIIMITTFKIESPLFDVSKQN